jgi:DNA-binding IclR family transcriptional regulator
MARSSAGESALSRAVRIFDAFDTGVRDLSATQIAEKSGMPLSTTHQLLGELVHLGLLDRLASRRYRIGLRLWELAVRTPGALGIREIAMPILRAAHAVIGQNLQLGVLDGADVLYLERLSAPRAAVNLVVVGGRMPYHSTSSGLVLIAFAERDQREELIVKAREPFAYSPLLTPPEMRRQLTRIRAQGYAVTVGYVDPAATAIAVPVAGPLGGTIAAISAIVPTADPREEAVLSVLLPASRAISSALRRHYSGQDPLHPA